VQSKALVGGVGSSRITLNLQRFVRSSVYSQYDGANMVNLECKGSSSNIRAMRCTIAPYAIIHTADVNQFELERQFSANRYICFPRYCSRRGFESLDRIFLVSPTTFELASSVKALSKQVSNDLIPAVNFGQV
jgi:hypothetical protein